MTRSRKPLRARRVKGEEGAIFFEDPLNGIDRDLLRKAFADAGKEQVEEFPQNIEKLKRLLETYSPLSMLATTSTYSLHVGVTKQGVGEPPKSLQRIGQHGIELLQALALTIPAASWGKRNPHPSNIQEAFDLMETLNDGFHMRRHCEIKKSSDPERSAILALQEGVRLLTQSVRNWGYFGPVVRLVREIYSPFDDAVSPKFGFTITQATELFLFILRTIETRSSRRMRMLQRVFRERKPQKMIRAYYKENPQFEGSADELIRRVSDIIHDRQQIGSILVSHSYLALPDVLTFTVEELAETSKMDTSVIANIVQRFSLAPGNLKDANPEHFFMGNPVWLRPMVGLDERTVFCPLPQLFFSFSHEILTDLIGEVGEAARLERRRTNFLEQKCEALFRQALPEAKITPKFKWKECKNDLKEFENDLVVICDAFVIVVEAKSGMVSPPALRGATDSAKRHIRELILHPSQQSERLEKVLRNAMDGVASAVATARQLEVDPTRMKYILRLSVSLTDLTPFLVYEREFQEVGWVERNHELAVTVNIADLECIVDLLQPSPHLLNYLTERTRLQRALKVFGDELDWLGLYIDTCFNFGTLETTDYHLAITGMSAKVDQYYNSLDAGFSPAKPHPSLSSLWQRCLDHLETGRFSGWTSCAVALLQGASLTEQKQVEDGFESICRTLEKRWRDKNHTCCAYVVPPKTKNTALIFYAYPKQLSAKRHETAKILCDKVFSREHIQRCIIFGNEVNNKRYEIKFVTMCAK